ncbi:DUF3618 domain-containing protein [Kitasatospora paranensis]|uniref:DUF3618 domain-containing protein n=1 Tax=Kitasatospora paranensis TaxID=258053 RepID=UPI0031EBAFAF
MADLTSQIADTRDRLADAVEELTAKADVSARAREAADQAKARVNRTADHARQRAIQTTDHVRHTLEEGVNAAAHSVRVAGGRAKEHAAGLTRASIGAVRPQKSARGLALSSARYGGPALAAAGAVILGTAAVLTLTHHGRQPIGK